MQDKFRDPWWYKQDNPPGRWDQGGTFVRTIYVRLITLKAGGPDILSLGLARYAPQPVMPQVPFQAQPDTQLTAESRSPERDEDVQGSRCNQL